LCNRLPERLRVDVIHEAAPPVDLDDRNPLPVGGLEGWIAVDCDFPQIEAELLLRLPDDPPRRLAEMAAGRGVQRDLGYG
jgi:hypothetical protein